MEVPDETIKIHLCCASVTPVVLAQIATALESGNPVFVEGAAIPNNGPGAAAYLLGLEVQKVEQERKELNA